MIWSLNNKAAGATRRFSKEAEIKTKFEVAFCLSFFFFLCFIILSTPSFGGEVKPSVPCRRFAACKRSLHLRGSWNLGKIIGNLSRPQFHLSLLGSLASLRTYRHLAAKVGTSKGGGKQ